MQVFLAPTTPIEALTLTFVDVETTGLDPDNGDRVCEIALLRVQNEQEVARFASLVHPQRPMAPRAMAVNGITDAMLTTAPPFPTLLPHIQPLLHDTVLVAHNAHFDVRFLRHEFELARQVLPQLAVVDTLALAQAWYRFRHNSLASIAAELGINNAVSHRALADVLTTWHIWQRFMADKRQERPLTLASVIHPKDHRSTAELEALSTTLQEALQASRRLHLRYKAGNAAETLRVIQPLELHYERGYGYLRAFCHMRQEERHFRFDRIVELKLLHEDGTGYGMRDAACDM